MLKYKIPQIVTLTHVYEERMRNARNLRVSSDVIVQATGLPEEEIKAL